MTVMAVMVPIAMSMQSSPNPMTMAPTMTPCMAPMMANVSAAYSMLGNMPKDMGTAQTMTMSRTGIGGGRKREKGNNAGNEYCGFHNISSQLGDH